MGRTRGASIARTSLVQAWHRVVRRVGLLILPGLIGLLAGLNACTAPELSSEEEMPQDGEHGVVMLSLWRSGLRDSSIVFNLRGVEGAYFRVIVLQPRGPSLDWPGPESFSPAPPESPLGRLTVITLPAGDYEIFGWKADSDRSGYFSDGYEMFDDRLELRFTVKAGTLRYLGALHLELPTRPDFRADLIPAHYRLHVQDRLTEDRNMLQAKLPKLGAEPVESALIERSRPAKRRYFLFNKKSDGDPLKRRIP